jgi:hypothetical protein
MRKRIVSLAILLFGLILIAQSQTVPKSDSIVVNMKARYLKGDLTILLSRNTNYPTEKLQPNSGGKGEGDVILSVAIHKEGKSEFLTVVSSPDQAFTTSAVLAFNKLEDEWSPAIINNDPVDKNYLIVFRYRKYMDIQPYDYKGRIKDLLSKQKYKEALKTLNRAINDNKYSKELLESRAKVKRILGDSEGAEVDELAATKLNDEILSLITVQVVGVSTRRAM